MPMPPVLPGEVAPKPRQARQQMLQLRQFHLQFAFARPGALRENIQDQRRAVQHLAAEDLFQIPALRRGKSSSNTTVSTRWPAESGELLRFAAADERAGYRRFQLLLPSPTTAPPAVTANSPIHPGNRAFPNLADLNSKPMRKTRSVLFFLRFEMSAFNVSHPQHSTNRG